MHVLRMVGWAVPTISPCIELAVGTAHPTADVAKKVVGCVPDAPNQLR